MYYEFFMFERKIVGFLRFCSQNHIFRKTKRENYGNSLEASFYSTY
jgi:hypothetical protein